jgi:hypothetical protein
VSEDLAHDPHLRAALRHAPDHALSPPSGLSQTILAAARQAHQPVRPTAAPPPVRTRAAGSRAFRRWLQRLFAPRWAGAWAVGLVAALGLGLWLDLETQPVLERTDTVAMGSVPPPTAASSEVAPAPMSGDASAADDARLAAKSEQVAPPALARATQHPAATATTPSAAAPAAQARVAEQVGERRKDAVASTTEQGAAAAPPPSEPAARQEVAAAAPTAQDAIVAAAPANSQHAGRVAAQSEAPAASPPAASSPARAEARANDQPPAPGAMAPRAVPAERSANTAELGEAVAAASPALTLLRRARAELASGAARWAWATPGAATMTPLDDAAQAWLSRVVQAAAGRWVEVNQRGESLEALEVRWWRDGWPHATLRIEAEGLRWIEPSGRVRYAPLDAATLQRLRSF